MTRIAVVALAVMAMMISLAPAVLASTETVYYYPDDDGWPSASLKTSSPTNTGPMPDIDSNGKQGRRIDKSDKDLGETDPKHYHQWSAPAAGLEITGSATLTIWFADKSFNDGDDNRLLAYLLDCGTSTCSTLATASKDVQVPDGDNVFAQTTLTFPAFDHEFASGRSLRLRIMIDKDFSDDDMTFAYDTTAYPARLKLNQVVPPPTTTTTTTSTTTTTTTTTSTTTTTLPRSTTTTTTPIVTTTTEPTPTTTTDSTKSTADSTTTSGPETTTTTIPTTSTTTGATPTTTAAAGTATPTTTLPPPAELDTEKTNLVIKTTPEQRGVLVSADSVEMTPVEGLMVTFVSAAETVRTNLLSSVGLGLIMASLLVIGMSRRSAEDHPEG